MFLNNGFRWLDCSPPFRVVDIAPVVEAPLLFYPIPFTHYRKKVAGEALSEFRSIMDVSDSHYFVVKRALTALPRRLGRPAFLIGLPLAGVSVTVSPGSWGKTASDSPLLVAYESVIVASIIILTVTFFLSPEEISSRLRLLGVLMPVTSAFILTAVKGGAGALRDPPHLEIGPMDPSLALGALGIRAGPCKGEPQNASVLSHRLFRRRPENAIPSKV